MDEEQLAKVREGIATAEANLAILAKDLRDADKAGLPQSDKRERYNELKEKIRKIKAVYGG